MGVISAPGEVVIFRVTTRADLDGLVSAALLSLVEDIDRFRFIEPGPFQQGELEITSDDIIANLPYRPGCAMWFDHHLSNETIEDFRGSWWVAPSAARVIYEYYANGNLKELEELVTITDRIDSATLTAEEIRDPSGYILISMTIDGRIQEDEPYWLTLVELFKKNDLKATLAHEDVRKRCDNYQEVNAEYGEVLGLYSDLDDNVLVTDFRKRWNGELGNRFLAFTLFPECDIWVRIMDSPNKRNESAISVGRSIFNQISRVNVGELLSRYGGGGHVGAGGCRVSKNEDDRILKEIIEACKHT